MIRRAIGLLGTYQQACHVPQRIKISEVEDNDTKQAAIHTHAITHKLLCPAGSLFKMQRSRGSSTQPWRSNMTVRRELRSFDIALGMHRDAAAIHTAKGMSKWVYMGGKAPEKELRSFSMVLRV